jgi:Ulp1 family protease
MKRKLPFILFSVFALSIVGCGNNSSLKSVSDLSSSASIFVLDSLNKTTEIDKRDLNVLTNLITNVQKRKKQLDPSFEIVKKNDIEVQIIETHQQQNGIDCGVFLLFLYH